jgi:hypothetical protein
MVVPAAGAEVSHLHAAILWLIYRSNRLRRNATVEMVARPGTVAAKMPNLDPLKFVLAMMGQGHTVLHAVHVNHEHVSDAAMPLVFWRISARS